MIRILSFVSINCHMRFLYHSLLAILPLSLLVSCVKDVTMDAMADPEVVVACVLSDEPVQTLRLVYTKGASREQAPDLPEAEAVLTDLTEGKEAGRFARAADGSWQLSYTAIPAHRYRLDVTVPGHEPIWAEQTMPEAPEIDVRWDWWREHLPEDAKYRNNHGYIFSAGTLHSPVWFYGTNYPDAASDGELTEYLYTDFPDVDGFNEDPTRKWSGDASMLWNCRFSTSSYPDLEGAPYHRNYLRFPAREGERTDFLVSGEFRNYLADPKDFVRSGKRFSELHWFSASEEYDRYLTDSYLFGQADSSTDLADIFLRDNLYSNIQGAVGMFGAKVERSVRWDDDLYWGEGPFFFPRIENKVESRETFREALNTNFQYHRPFSLLLYEVKSGHCKEWKFGENWQTHQPSDSVSFSTLYCIEDDDQLREHGMADYGPVDFSSKTVLAIYSECIGYGYPLLVDWQVCEDQENGLFRMTVFMVMMAQGSVIPTYAEPYTSSRVAIVVDKVEKDTFSKLVLRRGWATIDDIFYGQYYGDELLAEWGADWKAQLQ